MTTLPPIIRETTFELRGLRFEFSEAEGVFKSVLKDGTIAEFAPNLDKATFTKVSSTLIHDGVQTIFDTNEGGTQFRLLTTGELLPDGYKTSRTMITSEFSIRENFADRKLELYFRDSGGNFEQAPRDTLAFDAKPSGDYADYFKNHQRYLRLLVLKQREMESSAFSELAPVVSNESFKDWVALKVGRHDLLDPVPYENMDDLKAHLKVHFEVSWSDLVALDKAFAQLKGVELYLRQLPEEAKKNASGQIEDIAEIARRKRVAPFDSLERLGAQAGHLDPVKSVAMLRKLERAAEMLNALGLAFNDGRKALPQGKYTRSELASTLAGEGEAVMGQANRILKAADALNKEITAYQTHQHGSNLTGKVLDFQLALYEGYDARANENSLNAIEAHMTGWRLEHFLPLLDPGSRLYIPLFAEHRAERRALFEALPTLAQPGNFTVLLGEKEHDSSLLAHLHQGGINWLPRAQSPNISEWLVDKGVFSLVRVGKNGFYSTPRLHPFVKDAIVALDEHGATVGIFEQRKGGDVAYRPADWYVEDNFKRMALKLNLEVPKAIAILPAPEPAHVATVAQLNSAVREVIRAIGGLREAIDLALTNDEITLPQANGLRDRIAAQETMLNTHSTNLAGLDAAEMADRLRDVSAVHGEMQRLDAEHTELVRAAQAAGAGSVTVADLENAAAASALFITDLKVSLENAQTNNRILQPDFDSLINKLTPLETLLASLADLTGVDASGRAARRTALETFQTSLDALQDEYLQLLSTPAGGGGAPQPPVPVGETDTTTAPPDAVPAAPAQELIDAYTADTAFQDTIRDRFAAAGQAVQANLASRGWSVAEAKVLVDNTNQGVLADDVATLLDRIPDKAKAVQAAGLLPVNPMDTASAHAKTALMLAYVAALDNIGVPMDTIVKLKGQFIEKETLPADAVAFVEKLRHFGWDNVINVAGRLSVVFPLDEIAEAFHGVPADPQMIDKILSEAASVDVGKLKEAVDRIMSTPAVEVPVAPQEDVDDDLPPSFPPRGGG